MLFLSQAGQTDIDIQTDINVQLIRDEVTYPEAAGIGISPSVPV